MSTTSTTTTTTAPAAYEDAGCQDAAKETGGFSFDHKLMKLGEYKGIMMPYYGEPLDVHVPKVMNMSLRDTDIILLSHPKSGSHWAWRVLEMLSRGSADYSDRCFLNSFLDIMPREVIDKVSKDVRRVLPTHYSGDMLPAQIKDGRVKVVHIYRHPKAVMMSLLYFLRTGNRFSGITMDELETLITTGKAPYKSQFYYFDKMNEYERDNPNVDIFHLAYEDMKKDTVGCIKKLAAYLNVYASDDLCTSIAEAVSFNTQKKHEESANDATKDRHVFLKGEIDDWKNLMTVAQSERMDKVLADRAASCQFCRRYCPTITTDQGDVYRLSSSS